MQLHERSSESQPYDALLLLEPKVADYFARDPANGKAQKEIFLADSTVRNPDHEYAELDIDFDARREEIIRVSGEILPGLDTNPKFTHVYTESIETYLKKYTLMQAAHTVKHGETGEIRAAAKATFMELNKELYGEPEEATYRTLLNDKLATIANKTLTGRAADLRDELFRDHATYHPEMESTPYKPSEDTIDWMHDTVMSLYGSLLAHVPDQATFTRGELVSIFKAIVQEEFGEAAEGWEIVLEPVASVHVRASRKQIAIPDKQKDRSQEVVKGLVVHELGVHFLRSVMGGETDLQPLAIGLNGYYDSEEGLGVVMEQALKRAYAASGTWHYIAAGAAYHDGKDFRDVFEMRWRIELLEKLGNGAELDDEAFDAMVEKAQSTAYDRLMRVFRGTDELPWFKDLAYYNGTVEMWKHLEAIHGDDIKFLFLLLGKADPSRIEHERIMYETKMRSSEEDEDKKAA